MANSASDAPPAGERPVISSQHDPGERGLLDLLPQPVAIVYAQAVLVYVNPAFAALAGGWSAAGASLADWAERVIAGPEHLRRFLESWRQEGASLGLELPLRGADPQAEPRHYHLDCRVLTNGQRLLCLSQRGAWGAQEEDLAQARQVFMRAFRAAPICLTLSTLPEGLILDVNDTFLTVTGYNRQEVVGRLAGDMNFYNQPERRQALLARLMAGENLRDMRLELRRKNGEVANLAVSMERLILGGRQLLLMSASDLSGDAQIALALRESEAKFRILTETTTSGIFIIQGDRYRYMNPAGLRMVGYSAEEITQIPFWEVVHPEYRDLVRNRGQARQQGVDVVNHYEFKLLDRQGRERWVDFSAAVMDYMGQPAMLGTVYDITVRRQAQEALAASEERFRTLTENAPDIIFTLGEDGALTYVNPSWTRILGHEQAELLGRPFVDFVQPQDAPMARDIFRRIRDEGYTASEVRGEMLSKQGRLLHFTLSGGRNLDTRGRVTGMVGVLKDISAQVELEDQLRHAQRMEAVGTLAGGVAHEFNNLLMAVRGYSQLLGLHGALPPRAAAYLEKIDATCQRGADLTRKMLTFTRLETGEKCLVDLNQVARGVWDLLRQTTSPLIEVRFEEEVNLPPVLANAAQLEQVLFNLALNARDATSAGGSILLRTRLCDLDQAFAQQQPWCRPGPYAVVEVTDTGHGMDPEVLARIFDPFFTTKEPGKGSGLGLSVAYSILKAHGGHLAARSQAGQGACFMVYLPVSDGVACPSPEPPAQRELPPGQGERILVVEDEPQLREIAREMLEGFGYLVSTASQGQEALSRYLGALRSGQPYDLVLMDLAMPVMDGLTCLEHLHQYDPEAKVLVVSGHGSENLSWGGEGQRQQEVLRKPYNLGQLLRQVRRCLDSQAGA